MQEIVSRIQKDQKFLNDLLANPSEATKGFDLTDQERAALSGTSAQQLGVLVNAVSNDGPGCGSSGTCVQTCTWTCTKTFTSIDEQAVTA